MNSKQWQESLKMINCMNAAAFRECFGHDDGQNLWEKFLGTDKNVFKFICYLDNGYAELLHDYCLTKMTINEKRD